MRGMGAPSRNIAQHLLLKTCPKKVHGRALTLPPAVPRLTPNTDHVPIQEDVQLTLCCKTLKS